MKATELILNDDQINSVHAKTSNSDEEPLKATQQIENNTVKGCFGKPLTEEEYYDLEKTGKNKNTEKKGQWAVRFWTHGIVKNGVCVPILASKSDITDLNRELYFF